jgi:hypothetical protein
MPPQQYAVEIVDEAGTVLATGQARLTAGTAWLEPWEAEINLDPPYRVRRWPLGPITLRLVAAPERAGRGRITFPGSALVQVRGFADSPPFWR